MTVKLLSNCKSFNTWLAFMIIDAAIFLIFFSWNKNKCRLFEISFDFTQYLPSFWTTICFTLFKLFCFFSFKFSRFFSLNRIDLFQLEPVIAPVYLFLNQLSKPNSRIKNHAKSEIPIWFKILKSSLSRQKRNKMSGTAISGRSLVHTPFVVWNFD